MKTFKKVIDKNSINGNRIKFNNPLTILTSKIPYLYISQTTKTMETSLQKIRWKDNREEQTVLIGITELIPKEDDDIFFYVENMAEIAELMQYNNGQDFQIV
jgi:hypothetical protein